MEETKAAIRGNAPHPATSGVPCGDPLTSHGVPPLPPPLDASTVSIADMSMGDDSVFASDLEAASEVQRKRSLLLELRAAGSEPTDDDSLMNDYLSRHRGSISAAIEMLSLFTDDDMPTRPAGGAEGESDFRVEDRLSLHGADYTEIIPAMLRGMGGWPDDGDGQHRGPRDAGDGAEDTTTSVRRKPDTSAVFKSLSDPCVPAGRLSVAEFADDALAPTVTSPTSSGTASHSSEAESKIDRTTGVVRIDSVESTDEFLQMNTAQSRDTSDVVEHPSDEANAGGDAKEAATERERNISVCSVVSEDDPALFLRALLTKGRQDSVASASSDASGLRVTEVTSPHLVLHDHSYDVEEPETTDAEDSQAEDDDEEQTLAGSDDEEDILEDAEEGDETPTADDGFPSILSPISERSEPGSSESRTPSPEERNPVSVKPRRGYNASQSLHGAMRSLMDKLKMPRWSAVERLAALPPPAAHQRALAATLAVSEYSPRPSLASSGDESDDTLGERVVEGSEGGGSLRAARSGSLEELASPRTSTERVRKVSRDLETHELEGSRRGGNDKRAFPLRRSCSTEELDELNEFLQLEKQIMSETEGVCEQR